eukprot:1074948-Pyramimonas_sp.AAC.1
MRALPVVSHVAQMWAPPKSVTMAEKNALQKLTCSQRFSFPPEALHQLRDLGHRVEARRLEVFLRACLLRAAINSLKGHDLKTCLQELALLT